MKPLLLYTAAIFLMVFSQSSCNPDCKSLTNLRSSTTLNPVGYEILLTANPISDLKGRKVFFGDVEANTVFHEDFGLVVEVPAGISGDVEITIEDPDCLDVQSIAFNVVNEDYLVENFDYVSPTPPEIIIPVVPISFPPNVDNAWLSPDNPEYCLWFTMYKEVKIDPLTNDTTITPTILVDPNNSFEQATCGCLRDFSVSNLPYAQNRMGGIVDQATNRIEIYVDRTPIGGGIEEYSGYFIDILETPYAEELDRLNCPDPCSVSKQPVTTTHMMLLTSKKTGRQVVAYQLLKLNP